MQTKPLPELTFNGRVLIPYDNRVDVVNGIELVVLFFTADTPIPANQRTWEHQLAQQGYILTGYGQSPAGDPHPYTFVEAARKAGA